MTEMTSEVFLERSSQKEPKNCLAQASGVPAWRHLVAVWQVNGSSGYHQEQERELGIMVSGLTLLEGQQSLWYDGIASHYQL